MDLLKAEMEKKRKAILLAKQAGGEDAARRKFIKASDLRRSREETQIMDGNKRARTEPVRDAPKVEQKFPSKEVSTKTDDKDASPPTKRTNSIRANDYSPQEVDELLRNLGLPIRLFGERTIVISESTSKAKRKWDDSKRLSRLQEAREKQESTMAGMSEMDEFRLGSEYNIRNPFLGGKKEQDEHEATPSSSALKISAIATNPTSKRDNTGKSQENKSGQEDEHEDESDPHKKIYRFFKKLLRQWEEDLALRPESVKKTAAGKNETKTLKQCKDYIRPLFKLCKNRRLEPSLMSHILRIVEFCEDGEFVKAHDAYMDVAIGRAAWPIGVTMVGIHARSGRAKIESANVAHVMNSELQRKYLTSVKRLMTYCQSKREDVAPSKKVF